ncbi:MAG: fumarylacetoacetate hydrolase family protein [Gammaproteobacteria bacterium]|nr:fumarylacetoacetate hydrolase family protein [Gammaproteobacteria bacterium]MBT8443448.1 fumarylacetoacetate hydrolase family protein [Gammaproteobacteria bacterium]NND37357.1 fumarylacetoacetate hydrolase family protein [Gammaproteobacteria bacterium]
MKIASFNHDGRSTYGLVDGDAVRPVTGDLRERYPDLRSAIAGEALPEIGANTSDPIAIDQVRCEPPIPNPGKIVCIGMNYRAHTAELKREQPDAPSLFTRFPDSVVGHGGEIIRPSVSEQLDFEGELAVIIGRTARHVTAADAPGYIAGYSCFLDGSVRNYQYLTSQFTAGKNFYHSGAFGPWFVTADEVGDPQSLRVTTRVSGETMQDGDTSQMVFRIGELIEFMTAIFPLEPGDVVVTGTPSGVGAAREPARWLVAGDVVEVEIKQIGVLRTAVVAEP